MPRSVEPHQWLSAESEERVPFTESATQLWCELMFSLALSIKIVTRHVDLLSLLGQMRSQLKRLKSHQGIFAMRKKPCFRRLACLYRIWREVGCRAPRFGALWILLVEFSKGKSFTLQKCEYTCRYTFGSFNWTIMLIFCLALILGFSLHESPSQCLVLGFVDLFIFESYYHISCSSCHRE